MSPTALRRWSGLHRWSSLACTAFLLLLCVTGLPLIFHDEIDQWLEPRSMARQAGPRTLEELVQAGSKVRPDRVVQFIVWEPATPDRLILSMGTSATAYPSTNVNVVLDRASARPLDETAGGGLMDWVLKLHGQLLIGPAGPPVLGLVALSFLLSVVSGVVLYAPFLRRLSFGTIRQEKGERTRRLDRHNLLGIVLAGWLLVVGGTGWVNAWGGYIFQIWRSSAMMPVADGQAVPRPAISPQHALTRAMIALPGSEPAIIAYPGSLMADARHYAVYLRGRSAIDSRLMKAALVDARTGGFTAAPSTPWYIDMLLLAQPLHFGDYGGMTLKLVWAVLDLLAIAVLWTGLRLWWRPRAQRT
jgi:uncharacterized iron-regulated membrane protein